MTRQTYKTLALILLLTVLFYWKILLTNQFSILAGFEGANQAFSWLNFWTGSLFQGQLPLWDPYTQCGRSFLGEMQTAAFYPLHLLLLLMSRHGMISAQGYQIWFVFVHLLGACFMYALVRELGCGRFPALVAGLCFSFGGFLGSIQEWPHLYEAAIWLPVVFLCLLRALRAETTKRAMLYAACGGLGLGMGVLAGGLHVVIMEALVVVSAAAYAIFQSRQTPAPDRAWRRPTLVALTIAGVGLCAGAVQLLPSMEYSQLAVRWLGVGPAQPAAEKIPYAYLSDGMWPYGLLQTLIHSAFGGSVGKGEVPSLYMGVFPLLAGIIGVWKCWSHAWVRYLAGLWAAALIYALGAESLLHGVLYALVPKLWLAREAGRFVFLAEFALAILAAFGLQFLFDAVRPAASWLPLNRIAGAVTVACALALAVPAVFGQPGLNPWVALSLVLIPLSYGLFRYIANGHIGLSARILVVGLVMFDLSAFNWTSPNKIELAERGTDQLEKLRSLAGVANYLKAQPGLFRVHLFTDLPMNLGDYYRVQTTRGAGVTMPKEYLPITGLDALLNVGYLVRPVTAAEPGEVYRDGNWKVYANPGACPRAWIVHQAAVEPSEQRTVDRLFSAEFDPRRIALVSAPLSARLEPVPDGAPEAAAIRAYRQNEVQVSVHAEGAGLLVLSEMYYPGWEATVNGKPATIDKVDRALRGIAVPRGDSQVVLRYRPVTVTAGAALSLTAFLGTGLLGLVSWRRRRTGRKKAQGDHKLSPIVALSVILTLSLFGCGAHTPDSKMISFFHAHEAAFDHLASMAQADMELYGLTREAVFVRRGENNWADATPQSISDSRWSSYQALFRELELPNGFAKDGPRISFLVDQVSIWNGDSSKGYVYSAEPLPTCALDLRVCAQKAPIVYGGATVYKFIKPRWYLWLFYN